MKKYSIHSLLHIAALATLASCTQETSLPQPSCEAMTMAFRMEHPTATRATATAFEPGDRVGLYVAQDTATLNVGGNVVSNEPLTCQGAGQTWLSRNTLLWTRGTYDIYAYYPYRTSVESVTDLPLSVSLDQSTARQGDTLGGYEASDILWASARGVAATESPVSLKFKHVMSRLTIRLIKGEDFEGEMPTEAQVYVHNTVTSATLDLAAGVATRDTYGRENSLRAHQRSNYIYEAIVVPQRITRSRPLVEVVMRGVSYLYESNFHFCPGKDHLVNIVITDNPDKAILSIRGEVEGW